jgi:hypothetical protein
MFTLKNKLRLIFRTVSVMVFIVCAQIFVPSKGASQELGPAISQRPIFNGHWWGQAASEERTGFLYALDECLAFDAFPTIWSDETFAVSEQKITKYYTSSSLNLSTSVQRVFEGLGKSSQVKRPVSVERYGDEFWRSHNDVVRRGFLEGYISCRAQEQHARTWSKPIVYYLDKLNDMYNADDRHGEDAPEYTGSILSALEKVESRDATR